MGETTQRAICGSSYRLDSSDHLHTCGLEPRHLDWHVCGVGACEVAWEPSASERSKARSRMTCECCGAAIPDDGQSRSVCDPCYHLHGYSNAQCERVESHV